MRQNALRKREESEVIIGNKVVTPKLVHTVMQVLDIYMIKIKKEALYIKEN